MAILIHRQINKAKSENVRKFTNRQDVADYMFDEVFKHEDFIKHVTDTSKLNSVSFNIGYDIITNYLIDILYEIDKNITNSRKKVKYRITGYFSLQLGFMISNTKNNKYKQHFKNKTNE